VDVYDVKEKVERCTKEQAKIEEVCL
jgi:hypothetical protein